MENKKLKVNYLPELKKLFTGRGVPSMVSVNLTNICNQHCIYCEIGQHHIANSSDLLKKTDLFWIIDQMDQFGISRLSLCGGEPFLFSDLIEVVRYAFHHQILCNITTNGTFISQLDHRSLEILKNCKSTLNISIDSFQETINNITRGSKTAFSGAISAIETLQTYQIPFIILTVISVVNYKDLILSLHRANELGIKQILYQPVISFSNFPELDSIDNKQNLNVPFEFLTTLMMDLQTMFYYETKNEIKTNLYRIIPWIEAYIKQFNHQSTIPFYKQVLPRFFCRESLEVIDIDYHGNIQPCGLIKGDIRINTDGSSDLFTLWKSATYALQNDLKEAVFPIECSGCCHKFGRNMLASVMKYPIRNRKTLLKTAFLLINREYNQFLNRKS